MFILIIIFVHPSIGEGEYFSVLIFIIYKYERVAISEKIIEHARKHDEFCVDAHFQPG